MVRRKIRQSNLNLKLTQLNKSGLMNLKSKYSKLLSDTFFFIIIISMEMDIL